MNAPLQEMPSSFHQVTKTVVYWIFMFLLEKDPTPLFKWTTKISIKDQILVTEVVIWFLVILDEMIRASIKMSHYEYWRFRAIKSNKTTSNVQILM